MLRGRFGDGLTKLWLTFTTLSVESATLPLTYHCRIKQHVRLTNPQTGLPEKFKERNVIPLEIHTDDERYLPFVHMHRRLLTSIVPELKRAMAARNYDDALAYLALLKRSTRSLWLAFSR